MNEKNDLGKGVIVGFGSCNRVKLSQSFWKNVDANEPTNFIWTGDAVYTKDSSLNDLANSFEQLSSNEYYKSFVENMTQRGQLSKNPMDTVVHGVWDDHDMGVNDGGSSVKDRFKRRQIYNEFINQPMHKSIKIENPIIIPNLPLYKTFTTVSDDDSHSIKFIILDTRYDRSDHIIPSVGSPNHPYYKYTPLAASVAAAVRGISSTLDWGDHYDLDKFNGDLLGEQQWKWLEDVLAVGANDEGSDRPTFHVIVSSIQIFTTNPVVESWGHFPLSKNRLFDLLHKYQPSGLAFLSGDVHHGEISYITQIVRVATQPTSDSGGATQPTSDSGVATQPASSVTYSRDIIEVTSSGLTHTCANTYLHSILCPIMLEKWCNGGNHSMLLLNGTENTPGSKLKGCGHRLTPTSTFIGKNYGMIKTRKCSSSLFPNRYCMDISVRNAVTSDIELQHTVESTIRTHGGDAYVDWAYRALEGNNTPFDLYNGRSSHESEHYGSTIYYMKFNKISPSELFQVSMACILMTMCVMSVLCAIVVKKIASAEKLKLKQI